MLKVPQLTFPRREKDLKNEVICTIKKRKLKYFGNVKCLFYNAVYGAREKSMKGAAIKSMGGESIQERLIFKPTLLPEMMFYAPIYTY